MRVLSLRSALCVSATLAALIGCGSTSEDATNNTNGGPINPGGGGSNTATGGGGQANGVAGSGNPYGGSAGVSNPGGGTAGTVTVGGSSGGPGGGAGGDTSVGGASGSGGTPGGGTGGVDPGGGGTQGTDCGMPAPAPIATLITAPAERYTHTANGRPAAVDLRVPIIMGKLIVDLGVDSGGVYGFGVDRGFHTFGGTIFHCAVEQGCPFGAGGEQFNTDCRWNTFDGMPHGDQNNMSPETSLSGQLKGALQELSVNAPGEGWEYFLDTNGNVRWGDVGFTGYSHGAQTAALIAVKQCIYRAVSRSGPRDNGCGNGPAPGNYDLATHSWPSPPYDANCTGCISTWITETPVSPMSVFYSFAGKTDGQFGDDQYTMDHLGGGFIGEPVNVSTDPPGDSHRFYADDGHGGFDGNQYWPALQKAWGVPDENMVFAAGN